MRPSALDRAFSLYLAIFLTGEDWNEMNTLNALTNEGAFDASLRLAINANFAGLFGALLPIGTTYFLDPVNGSDGNTGLTPTSAFQSLSQAYGACVAGKGDTVVLMSDGTTAATARVDAAFTWAKNNTHLIGWSSGVNISNRSRIAPTATTTAFANFFTVSASGCRFDNIQWFHGFNTGTTSAIAVTVTGGRNKFSSCHIAGMGDAASAGSAGSRCLKISGTGENQFVNCTIGIDTVTRTAANASVEFAGGCPRNEFIHCYFPFMTSAATPLGVIVSAAAGSDRTQFFENCIFDNAIKSSSTVMTALSTLAASMGGMHVYRFCTMVGITDFGSDSTSLAQIYVDGPSVVAATSGIAVNPT